MCAGLIALTALAGGFVAGLHAGLDYNTFPLMDGRIVPDGYMQLRPLLLNLVENNAAVQFDHRLLASLSLIASLATVAMGWRSAARPVLLLLAGAVGLQYALGIATLLAVVPPELATLHQAMAMLALIAALVAVHMLRSPHAGRHTVVQQEVPAP